MVSPAPGRDVVKPMKPDWCDAGHEITSGCDENCQARTVNSAAQNAGSGVGLSMHEVAKFACDMPDSKIVQQQVAYWRQDWINLTGLSEKENREELKLVVSSKEAEKLQAQLCASVKPTAPVESAQFERQRQISLALGCEGKFSPVEGHATVFSIPWMDRPDLPPSEIARVGFVLQEAPDQPETGIGLETYANIAADATRLDRKKLEEQIAALKLSPLGRIHALELFGVAKTRAGAALAEIKKQPKLVKVLVDAPIAAYNGWDAAVYRPHRALFDLAYAIEDAASAIDLNELGAQPHAVGKCGELRAGLRAYLASTKPRTRDGVLAAAGDAVSYPLLARLALCDGAAGHSTSDAAELQVLRQQRRYWHGPRMAAHWAAFDAAVASNNAVHADRIKLFDRDTSDPAINMADHISANQDWLSPLNEQTGEEGRERNHVIEQGKVAAVDKTRNGTLVTFKKESWMEPSYECKTNGRIMAFERDGTPIYSRDCKVVGQHQVTFQLEPRLFDEASAIDGIKPGMILKCVSSGQDIDKVRVGFVMAVAAPGAGKKPATVLEYFGVPLR